MTQKTLALCAALLALPLAANAADDAPGKPAAAKPPHLTPSESTSNGSVTIGGTSINYQAIAGTLVVHPKGFDDAAPPGGAEGDDDKNPSAEAAMFYVAYFKHDPDSGASKAPAAPTANRPITFLYNGGPGSSTVWLHMGAFGPQRVVTPDAVHAPAAPYHLANNDESLLDASDLVFIDAPGTGFGRIAGKDKEKSFYGVDQDAHAFGEFIMQFLAKYHRFDSPKYLFGESYGTTRSAVLANLLQDHYSVDLNGVILLSQILSFDLSVDGAEGNPGIDLPYELALPTYAATAWYHHKLDQRFADLPALLNEVQTFAMDEYADALAQGVTLPADKRAAIIGKLHDYTGLPAAYIDRANLRVDGGEFELNLQGDHEITTGRLDTRFSGPTVDPLSKEADYDPQSAAISSAYVSSFNDYARQVLKYGQGKTYMAENDLFKFWDFKHQEPGSDEPSPGATNVMPDLARALNTNPTLKVQLNAGFFDLATPYFEGWYEMHHLPMQPSLQGNIEYRTYRSGHMVYANPEALKQLHDNVADFIKRTDNLAGK
jgi:carboxypeptidase C (cathepsin A)